MFQAKVHVYQWYEYVYIRGTKITPLATLAVIYL